MERPGGRRNPSAPLALGAVAAALFLGLALLIAGRDAVPFDARLTLLLHGRAAPWLDAVMAALTALGSLPALTAVALSLALACVLRRDRYAALVLALLAAATPALIYGLKAAFRRVRPALWEGIDLPDSYSFPSGHAMGAAAIYGLSALVASRLWPRLGRWAAALAALISALVGVSRVYLGVHWPTDVIAGFLGGAAIFLAGAYLLSRRPRPEPAP